MFTTSSFNGIEHSSGTTVNKSTVSTSRNILGDITNNKFKIKQQQQIRVKSIPEVIQSSSSDLIWEVEHTSVSIFDDEGVPYDDCSYIMSLVKKIKVNIDTLGYPSDNSLMKYDF